MTKADSVLSTPPKAGESTCPVIPLALEFDALNRAYNNADGQSSRSQGQIDNERTMMIIWDRLDAIREQVSYLRPNSNLGAAFQIMQANVHLDVLTGLDRKDQRKLEAQMVRLLYRAVEYLMHDDERIADARQFSMGEHVNPHSFLKAIKPTWLVTT
jgi:hypothetical protein